MWIDWNVDALKAIRYGQHDPSIIGLLEAEGQKMAEAAHAIDGGHYAVGSQPGAARPQGRHRVSVVTADHRAIRGNAKNNSLIRAMGQR